MSAIITVLLLIAVVITLFVVGIHWGFRAPRQIENGTPQDLGFAFEQVWIPSVANKRLFGWFLPVSYTHLDVYKRQVRRSLAGLCKMPCLMR